MALSTDLTKLFAKQIVQSEREAQKTPTTHNGTIVSDSGTNYVRLDGSDQLTPITTTTYVENGDRVTVMIKDHTAIITGNVSSPSASQGSVDNLGDRVDQFDTILANKVDTDELEAVYADIDNLTATTVEITGKLTAAEADITDLKAQDVTITGKLDAAEADIDHLTTNKLDAEVAEITYATIASLEVTNADIHNLEADYGDFKVLHAEQLEAINANFDSLDSEYANIDFANIGTAAIEKLFADSGIIGDLVMSDGHVTGTLVGVTIKGDLIEGNTIVADKLVIKGDDGLFYKLNTDGVSITGQQTEYNSLNGSILTAKSVTAEKVTVDDLVAFGATIGGFNITNDSLYSGAKTSATNTTRGMYTNSSGEFSVGDNNNFLRFFKDTDGKWKLEINANSIKMGTTNTSKPLVVSTQNQFYKSTSPTSLSGGSWSTTQPAWSDGTYIFLRNLVTYSDGSTGYQPNETGVCITGNTGADGAPGAPGSDGNGIKSTSITYQASSSQTTAPTGTWTSSVPELSASKPYLWTKTVLTYKDDKTSTSYSVSSTLEGVEVGSRNLVLLSDAPNNTEDNDLSTSYPCAKYDLSMKLVAGETYTFTVNATFTNALKWAVYFGGGTHGTSWVNVGGDGTKTQSITFTPTEAMANASDTLHFYVRDASDQAAMGDAVCVMNWVKLEKGNVPTDWSPAPEDVEKDVIDAKNYATAQISTEKGNILNTVAGTYYTKDAATGLETTVSGHTEMIQTLNGWSFDFKTFKETEFPEALDNALEEPTKKIEEINAYIRFVDGDILLGKEENPITLRIQNDRIAFSENNAEVMYLNENKINITNAEITTRLDIGRFAFVPRANGNMSLVFDSSST